MNETKSPLTSIGIMGPVAALLVLTANHIYPGLGLTDADVSNVFDLGSALFAALTGIYGRWKATKQIAIIPTEGPTK